ncbi:radical SAM family heme chaperone HemW [Methylacidimicrobium sp. B4]|uniref:radical SAM family heme chaperone HemW n=1 Tax=Methylacidimicrobium sp. B4 TaxID=2796139 RepID=UPI001A8E908A|nr:radical SAM family heme chaperone HemW [Methylacidimicrobium sp. B4]QSR84215.1 radical SAM family heme chaperone HemW [Methylacidimicrobium sp. B4]
MLSDRLPSSRRGPLGLRLGPEPIRHLYLHTPFCATVCPYCAFHVHTGSAREMRVFVTALLREWEKLRKSLPVEVETLYLGGGTPSLLPLDAFRQLADAFRPWESVEATLEANPRTVTREKAAAWRDLGIGRVSLGVQSLDPAVLRTLGRRHGPQDVERTVAILREAGFGNINVDLLFGVPGQSPASWEETLTRVIAIGPEHVSAYELTYEEDTPFFEARAAGVWREDEELSIAMYRTAWNLLESSGYRQYEVSNYARPGWASLHNQGYWMGNDYLGLGPGACSTVGLRRWQNRRNTTDYIAALSAGQDPPREEEALSKEVRQRERLLLGLRTSRGVPYSWIEGEAEHARALIGQGLAELSDGTFRLTPEGRLLADGIAGLFVG